MIDETHQKPGEAPLPPLALLGRALAAAVVGRILSSDERELLDRRACFGGACSVRAALPLDSEGNSVALVSSDLRGPESPPSYWATPWDGSLAGRALAAGRTASAEGPCIHQLSDLRQLAANESGATFLCVPVLREVPAPGGEPGPAVAALLLSYPCTAADVPQDELRLVLLLAAQLTRVHGRELAAYVGRLYRALHPAEHSSWGPGFGAEYPELPDSPDGSESEWLLGDSSTSSGTTSLVGSGSGSGGGVGRDSSGLPPPLGMAGRAGRVLAHPTRRWALSPRTLRFEDDRTERRFQQWRASRLAKVDAAALLSLLLYYLAACFLPPTAGLSPARLASSLPAALTVLVPLLLVAANRSTRWYSRHRDQLLMCTYVLLACHQSLDASPQLVAGSLPEGLWRALVAPMELLWCAALGVILQVQFVGQCLMLAYGLALQVLVQPGCSGRLLSPRPRHPTSLAATPLARPSACLVDSLAWPLLLAVVLPCGFAYYAELSARRTFTSLGRSRRSGR